MTVVDASVCVNALLGVGLPGRLARAELRGRAVLEVPAIFGVEVVSALRCLVRQGSLSPERATAARERARRARMLQFPFDARLARAVGPRCTVRLV